MDIPVEFIVDQGLRSYRGDRYRYALTAFGFAYGYWKYARQRARTAALAKRVGRLESALKLPPMFPLTTKKTCGYSFMQPTFYTAHHLGQDYAAAKGTPLFSPFDGEITYAGDGFWDRYTAQMGVSVHLRYVQDGQAYVIRFAHLDPGSLKVSKGDRVTQGQRLADTGNTGLSTGPHLHLDISRNDVNIRDLSNFVDPQAFSFDVGTPVRIENAIRTVSYDVPSGPFTVKVGKYHTNARDLPQLHAHVFQVLDPGVKVACNGTVSGDPVNGNSLWYRTARSGKYIHSSLASKV